MEMPKRRAMKRWPQQLRVTAGSGGGRSAGAVSGWNAGAFSLDYEMRRRQPRRERDRQRRRTGWRQAGQGAERAAHGTRVMFVVLIGLAIVAMPGKQRQQRPFGITDLGVGAAQACRLERLGEVEGKVDRSQRVEGERQDAEPRGPDPASPLSHSHSVVPANGDLDTGTTLTAH